MELTHLCAADDFSLAVHGGAGPRPKPVPAETTAQDQHADALRAALQAGREILANDGSAADAVCAAVMVLEDDELFNAGRGAALTAHGTIELDAALMVGATGQAGAVTGTTIVRNPILAARAVMEHTPHVLLQAPSEALLRQWGVAVEDPTYFMTQRRLDQLAGIAAPDASTPQQPAPVKTALGHGTVGAVARDRAGNLAAATSTGGVSGQMVGRIGDSPVIGAGTYANSTVAISCTGIGEFFVRAVLAHDVSARMNYAGLSLPDAVSTAIAEGLTQQGGYGGLIAVDYQGNAVLAFNSAAMFRGYANNAEIRVEV